VRLPPSWREETIYTAIDGRTVERIVGDDGQSYIRKPVSPNSCELWIYENLLGLLPPIYPRMLDNPLLKGGTIEENPRWLWFEDIGQLTHNYDLATAHTLVQSIAHWHSMGMEYVKGIPLRGLKPSYQEMASDLVLERMRYTALASQYDIAPSKLDALYSEIERMRLSDLLVFSHGDLHVGNYAFANGRLYVLDWEHAHFNSRYWDLFHLIDLTHPLYPRKEALQWRDELLQAYVTETDKLGIRLERHAFLAEYKLFSAVFSLWMLSLIHSDITKPEGIWTHAQFRRQAEETARILHQLLQR
jgi:Predicted choline kinase involved in LPS biosynthesis